MIKIKQLSYRYARNKEILSGLDLELNTGKIYGLLGKNGTGKSTLIRNIAGTLFPSEGSCMVLGYEPKRRKIEFLREVFFVPEECFLPNLSIRKFVEIYAPYYPRFDKLKFQVYLKAFSITPDQPLQALSFGQKKKVIIGFALATKARLLIMDEPTNGLDIPSKVLFRNMIKEATHPNQLVLITSHQVRDLDELITDLMIMGQGKILLHASKIGIQKRLFFQVKETPSTDPNLLYEEKQASGWAQILKNPYELKSSVDMELLFNATLNSHENIHTALISHVQSEMI